MSKETRVIKFRVWDNVDYMSNPFTLEDMNIRMVTFTPNCPVMQFTGLQQDGQEFYEGDIVEFIDGKRCVIEWNDDTCQFQFSDGSAISDGDRYSTYKKIIGNIFENENLLNHEIKG